METLHPFFVHFPVALLFTAALFDLFAVIRSKENVYFTAYTLQCLGAFSAVLAAFTGNLAKGGVMANSALVESISPSLEAHVSWGNSLVWVIVIFALGRTFAILEQKDWARSGWLFPLASSLLASLVIFTALLGGQLTKSILAYYISS